MIRGSVCSSDCDLSWVLANLESSKNSPNQFEYWYPHIVSLGIPTPKTQIIPLSSEVIEAVYRQEPLPQFAQLAEAAKLISQIEQIFESWGVDALFLKNSLGSAKHMWKHTCHLPKHPSTPGLEHHILSHIGCNLYVWIDNNFILPTGIILRELLDVNTAFHAFEGTPITQEFRLFIEGGRVVGYQPYWPEDSILDADVDDWREKLQGISLPSPELLLTMTRYAEQITLPHDWSVDFLIDKEGKPWLIDMALMKESFKASAEQGYVHCPVIQALSTEAEHNSALLRASDLLSATLSAPESLELERLTTQIELYEKANFKIEAPSESDMIKFRANEQSPR